MTVRINGQLNPEYLNRLDDQKKSSSSKASTGHAGEAGKSGAAESIKGDCPLIQAALSAPEVNAQAVEEARQALLSGQLDTPDAARRAAEHLLDLGL